MDIQHLISRTSIGHAHTAGQLRTDMMTKKNKKCNIVTYHTHASRSTLQESQRLTTLPENKNARQKRGKEHVRNRVNHHDERHKERIDNVSGSTCATNNLEKKKR
ncbi:hypothetical protein, unlikely [Trypanosoma brucei gambiense DAL972]|uniref:Uncharacterized protein n=1 Tax=Trypanosoma brucei gambiense (strain MHOM/CI/86/DAL972) TaxID=679716 RepID=D0A804_TRYB9|nr:hypothetical protein, unlikely [Trypanosoma brucei gambiense DAL972]CBH17805.1 hypothetical protein, unlikely [Trypanosoma brucei gambiense DAL972]|eukprot:XP_011780069.1 hypothetical protein, unlikely [Trypanosoma brucei gambiense DAL972]